MTKIKNGKHSNRVSDEDDDNCKRDPLGHKEAVEASAKQKGSETQLASALDETPVTKRGPGRPTSYDPKYCDVIVAVARRGGDDAAMVLACGLSAPKSMWVWRQKYPEFKEAYNYAKLIQLERDEVLLDAYVLGKIPKGHFKALEMRLRNRDPEKYGAVNPQHINQSNTQINIHGNIQTIESMSMDDINKRINESMHRLGPLIEGEVIENDED